jgi:hypothetical protein
MQRALLFVFMRSMVLMGVMVDLDYSSNYSWFEAYAAAVVHDGLSLLLLRHTSF